MEVRDTPFPLESGSALKFNGKRIALLLSMLRMKMAGLFLVALFSISSLFAQTSSPETQTEPNRQKPESSGDSPSQPAPSEDTSGRPKAESTGPSSGAESNSTMRQPKRILGIIPNYRSVSADVQLPPLSPWGKFKLATQDSFDYSSFIFAGMVAGVAHLNKSVPEFGQGAPAYGRYYWHSLADEISGNYLTEAIVPILTHEDPRYYTRGHGTFLHRTGYALSRLVITRTDSGHATFNVSEILGNGVGSAVSDLYYPGAERTWIKTRQRWTMQIGLDGVSNVVKEFWPDIRTALSRKH
jgi:hypothetical protein